MDKKILKLIIGLGNPGKEYELTYHNIGFLTVDFLARQFASSKKWKKTKYFQFFKTDSFIFAKTSVFMNESGKAVADILKYFQLQPKEILVIHDDSDIALGEFKFSFNREAAGHHGVESIIKALKTKKFWRLRIGSRPATEVEAVPRKKAGDFVLKKISPADKKILEEIFRRATLEIFTPS